MLIESWCITLLGELKAEQTHSTITRFRTRKAASLFAFLACHPHRSHAREEVVDRFWPEDPPETAHRKLRLALASLRRQLEPIGVQTGTVLFADRTHLRLNAHAIETDVAAFEANLREAHATQDPLIRIGLLTQALSRYGGDMLPGDYEEWALQERERLHCSYLGALAQIVELSEAQNDIQMAIAHARRLVLADPLQEEAHVALIRLYIQAGRPHDASHQYAELAACLKQECDSLPGKEAQALAVTLPVCQPRGNHATRKAKTGISVSKTRTVQLPAPPHFERRPATTSATADSRIEQARANGSAPYSATPLDRTPASSTPPVLSFDLRLPIFLTRCIGRHEDVGALAALLDASVGAPIEAYPDARPVVGEPHAFGTRLFLADCVNDGAQARLVTLTGPGGAGKTRLAVEAARFLQTKVTYPIAFIGLAEVTDAGHILRHVADALHLPHTSHVDPLSQIADRLQTAPALLILDNFEQLTPDGVSIIQALLTRMPALRCLTTSRHHLGLSGERTFAVQPLPISASQQLFLDRARAVRPDFQITPHNAPSVAMLCEQLEGLPLALELAASWIGVLTPAQILARMNRRFDLLISRGEDRIPRHRELRATIAWSCELLSPELQTFLARMSVFRGGWTEQAAQVVGGAPHAVHLLAQLRERSLVVSEESENGATMRFRLLESIREFAETQMDEAMRQEARRTHAAYFLRLAEEADKNITGPEQTYWFASLEPEHPNIRAALDWQASEPEALEAQLRLIVAMRIFWRTQGHLAEARQRMDEVLARPGADAFGSVFGAALVEAGLVASMQGDQDTARQYAQRALARARLDNSPALAASAINTLGNVAKRLQEYENARDLYSQSLKISREISDRRMEATAVANLGNIAQEQGDYDRAAACYLESLAVYRQLHYKQGLVMQLYNLAALKVQTDDYAGAAPLLVECLTLCRETSDTPTIMHALEVFGFIADEFAQQERAIELYAAAAHLRIKLGLPMSPRGRAYMEEVLTASRSRVGSEEFDRLWQLGTDAHIEQAIAVAGRIRVPVEATVLDSKA